MYLKIYKLTLFIFFSFLTTLAAAENLYIKGDTANVREGPATNFDQVEKLYWGDVVEMISEDGGWYKVRLKDERFGWIYGEFVSKTKPLTRGEGMLKFGVEKTVFIKIDTVNVRYGPGTNYKKIGKAYKGQDLKVLKEQNGWYRLDMGGGKVGWIYGKLVSHDRVIKDKKSN